LAENLFPNFFFAERRPAQFSPKEKTRGDTSEKRTDGQSHS
jgi:hypothetical protein